MIRISRFKTYRDLQPAEIRQAVEVAQQTVEAVRKVPGVKSCKLCLSSGELVFVTEAENYATGDAALADPGVQAAGARMGAEFGYRPSGDEWLSEVAQLMPFVKG